MYKDLLPIGSIVLLKGGERKLMVCGRIISDSNIKEIYDYVGCLYPEGITNPDNLYFFNRDSIEKKYFIGCQDQEEIYFQDEILSKLGELEIVDGAIVEKSSEKEH